MKLNVNVEDELYYRFKAAMAEKRMTISDFIRRAMADFLKADEIVREMKTGAKVHPSRH